MSDIKRTVVKIGGMHCAGCVNSIQRHVANLQGVGKIEVNLANEKAIEEIGYRVVYEKVALVVEGITDSSDERRLEQSIVLIPVAAIGMLYPALAGLAMAASSVSVTASSLGLKRWTPPRLR